MSLRRQFLTVSSGTLIAQGLSFALMPFITRLYLPAEMGEYSLSASIYSVLGLIANLRLDLAIVVAETDRDARSLTRMAFFSSLALSILSYCALAFWYGANLFSLLTALSVLATGAVQTSIYWASRNKKSTELATRNILEKFVVLLLGLALGYWGYSKYGLIVAQILGFAVSIGYIMWRVQVPLFESENYKAVFSKYREFPQKNIASGVLMALAIYCPSLFFAEHFSREDLGQYGLVSRLFEMPIGLVGFAFTTVYFRHSTEMALSERRRLFWRTLKLLLIVFCVPLLIVGFFGEPLFKVVFGESWAVAGQLALWLAPLTLARLLFVSQWSLLLVQKKLTLELLISALLFTSQILGFYLGLRAGSLSACVAWMSILGASVYLFGLYLTHRSLQ